MPRLLAALLPALMISGCCDCMISSVMLDVVDEAGQAAEVDGLRLTLDDGAPTDQPCSAEEGGCSSFLVPATEEGTLRIEALVDDAVVGSAEVEVVMGPKQVGQCCSGGFHEDRELTVDLPPAS